MFVHVYPRVLALLNHVSYFRALIRVERDVSANPEVAQTAQQKHIKKVFNINNS